MNVTGIRNSFKTERAEFGGQMGNLQECRKRKRQDLSDVEKRAVRIETERGKGDVYKLAKKFNCVPTQIAGIKARMKF
jgi:hypothetical protein